MIYVGGPEVEKKINKRCIMLVSGFVVDMLWFITCLISSLLELMAVEFPGLKGLHTTAMPEPARNA